MLNATHNSVAGSMDVGRACAVQLLRHLIVQSGLC